MNVKGYTAAAGFSGSGCCYTGEEMSLQFIIGPSGSGKTEYMHREMLKRAAEDVSINHLLLVPEQFNLRTQQELVKKSPVKGIMNIDILSFARLCHRIFDEAGGNKRNLLDDCGKSMIIKYVADRCEDRLGALAGKLSREGYINEIKSVISEFMQYRISPEALEKMIENNNMRHGLKEKLKDLQLVYKEFVDYLGQEFVTSEGILERGAQLMGDAAFLSNAQVYLDGYTGFTPIQLQFIEQLLLKCRRVVVTVTVGNEMLEGGRMTYADNVGEMGDENLFLISQKTIYFLKKLAESHGVAIDEPVILNNPVPYRISGSKALSHIEKNIFRSFMTPENGENEKVTQDLTDDVELYRLPDMRSETAYVCRRIHMLVREKGYRYRDIAVLSGNLEEYVPFILTEADKYHIPAFIDRNRKVLLNPLIELVNSVVGIIVSDFGYEAVMRYLHCGLSNFEKHEIDELDNYIIASGIKRRKGYENEWTYLPKDYDDSKLELLNGLRERLVRDIVELRNFLPARKKALCRDMCRGLYDFIKNRGVYQALSSMASKLKENGDDDRALEYEQIYNKLIELFERLYEVLGNNYITTAELLDIINSGLGELSVGIAPMGTDQVVFGDMERSRLSEVKVLFVMGANDGVIPRDMHKTGILSELDRQLLKEQQIELAPGTREQAFIQRFYLYMYLTKPQEKLCISYSSASADGSMRMPSYLIGEIVRLLPQLEIVSPDEEQQPVTAGEGFEQLLKRFDYDLDEITKQMIFYYKSSNTYENVLKKALEHAFRRYENNPLSDAAAKALYGETISGNVTRLENYAHCAYSHFLKYGLRLKEKREFSFRMTDLGEIYHGALEKFGKLLRDKGVLWNDISEEEAISYIADSLNEVLIKMKDEAIFESARSSYNSNKIKRVLERTIKTLTYQVKSGEFVPSEYEHEFEEKHGNMRFRGKIDRLDILKDGNDMYVKVIDYKSGNNTLKMPLVYEGIALQLMVYLNEAVKSVKRQYKAAAVKKAGALYYHIDDPVLDINKDFDTNEPDKADIEAAVTKALIPKGIISGDEYIVRKMDREIDKKSDVIPVSLKADGSISKLSAVISPEELEEVCTFVIRKIAKLSAEILEGNITVSPFAKSRNAKDDEVCGFCTYRNICGFDQCVKGYEIRKPVYDLDEDAIAAMVTENAAEAEKVGLKDK